ncbi:hypothetical protein AOCH_000163 [Aspergillus ochraceoroseus]|uniref:Siderophore iron transporter mirB n=1 Tax=Aspergillus ochraceoroseus TaxID=138278 RepID=A0A0F8VGP6_9EURO|nr:hypothetical protein AOCH_000163 [Aspergillus ochraceoroseus]
MGIRSIFRRQTTDTTTTTTTQIDTTTAEETKQGPATDVAAAESNGSNSDEPKLGTPAEELQPGVSHMEAMTQTWSKWALIAVFLNIWMLYFTNAFQSAILSSLIPFITSDWESHSLLNTIYIVADAITAACYIPLAKIMDLWGRAEGFLFMTICATVGLIMMAGCNNLATFCAAYVFYSLGFGGMTYCVDVITADTSMLRSRGLAYAFTSSPYIITAFAGPKAADDAIGPHGIGMRWPFGIFSIIFPIVAAPLYGVLKYNIRKAEKAGRVVKEKSGRNIFQSIWFYIIELDVVGVVLFSAGLVLFFLPFDIAGSAPSSWQTPYIIAMLVVGFVLLFVFIFWEVFMAPKPMFQFSFLYNRTVIGACLLDATYQLCYYCWNNYFSSFLMVVNDLSVADAGYVTNTFDVVSGVLLLIVGLMIYFRRPDQSVGYQVMCQIFISIGGSVFILVEQLSILAAVDHQHVASVLALLNVVGTIGDSMGATISSAIWQNTYPNALQMYLPESAMWDFDMIYEDIDTQLKYAVGTPTRLAIQHAYGYAQTRMLAVGTGIMGLAFIWTMMIRNIDLKKVPQVAGTVF